jgi:hypothetical protein
MAVGRKRYQPTGHTNGIPRYRKMAVGRIEVSTYRAHK